MSLALAWSAALAAQGVVPADALPDAELLEFLADWSEDASDWLDAELDQAVDDGAAALPVPEKVHD